MESHIHCYTCGFHGKLPERPHCPKCGAPANGHYHVVVTDGSKWWSQTSATPYQQNEEGDTALIEELGHVLIYKGGDAVLAYCLGNCQVVQKQKTTA